MQTAEIIRKSVEQPLHLRAASDLLGVMVSRVSEWYSPHWDLDNPTHGAKASSRINWDIALPDGSRLLDKEHAVLLDWLRRFVWSLFTAPGDNANALKPGTASHLSRGIATLVPWLVENSIRWPRDLDARALDTYLADLPAILSAATDDDEDSTPSRTSAWNAIAIIYKVWQQRRALSAAGIEPMPAKPWPGLRAHALATSIATDAIGWIQPLPDEVAVPLLNKAMWFIGIPAEDVMRMQGVLDAAYLREPGAHHNGPGTSDGVRGQWQRSACRSIKFSTVDGDAAPWHRSLGEIRRTDGRFGGMLRALQLVKSVQAAAMLVVQGFTGLRVSELCGLRAGINLTTGLPECVELRPSSTGLNEEFILRGDLSKTEAVPREVPWLLGMRPQGATDLPPPVHALLVLNHLLRMYRDLIGSDRLLVSICSKVGLPKTAMGVVRITGQQVNNLYRDFIEEWVDLTCLQNESRHRNSANDLVEWKDSSGRIMTSHQLRKTYARYVLATEPRLLPAIKRQFHHLSMAMTESGYWGTNILQIEPVNAVAAQETAMFMFELATGRTKAAGRMGKHLETHIDELCAELAGMGIEAGWRKTMQWVRDNALASTFGPHGGCLPLRTSVMECWKRSGKRPLGHSRPNYRMREPGVCAGCECFWMDARHQPFWEQRYVENEAADRDARRRGMSESFRRVHGRAVQARGFLQHIGVKIATLEGSVELEIASHAEEN